MFSICFTSNVRTALPPNYLLPEHMSFHDRHNKWSSSPFKRIAWYLVIAIKSYVIQLSITYFLFARVYNYLKKTTTETVYYYQLRATSRINLCQIKQIDTTTTTRLLKVTCDLHTVEGGRREAHSNLCQVFILNRHHTAGFPANSSTNTLPSLHHVYSLPARQPTNIMSSHMEYSLIISKATPHETNSPFMQFLCPLTFVHDWLWSDSFYSCSSSHEEEVVISDPDAPQREIIITQLSEF